MGEKPHAVLDLNPLGDIPWVIAVCLSVYEEERVSDWKSMHVGAGNKEFCKLIIKPSTLYGFLTSNGMANVSNTDTLTNFWPSFRYISA